LITGKASRAAESVKKALDIVISTLKARNFTVSVNYSVGEDAIGKIISQLNLLVIEVTISGAGAHVSLESTDTYELLNSKFELTLKDDFHLLLIFLD
jgi:hypothetical protein